MMRVFWRNSIVAVLILTPAMQDRLPAQVKPAPRGKAVATFGSEVITDEQLTMAASEHLEKLTLQQRQSEAEFRRQRHEALEVALHRLLEERLLEAEARRLGIGRAELLSREVEQKVQTPTQEQVNAFYESNKARIPIPKEQALQQIPPYLRQQNLARTRAEYFDRLRKQHGVKIALEPLRFDVESAGHPSRGPESSPVTIVEFSDFKCDFCRGFNATLGRVLKRYGDAVRLVFRQFPLAEIHPEAPKAAEASLCAADQGKFWQMHDFLFAHQDKLGAEGLKGAAATLGLDTAAFNACLDSGKHAGRVKKDLLDGARSGVSGTPATFINGRFVGGARPYEDLAGVIEDELERKGDAAARNR